jgi:hypothetical protein
MKRYLVFACAALLSTGCASVAVTQDALETRTAHALGLTAGTFKITNRQDEGVTTRYVVTTNTGATYNCYVGGSFSVIGRSVSEAICNKPGEGARNPLLNR